MTRRWALWSAFAALVLALLAGTAAWGFRDNLFRQLIKPEIPFQVFAPPPAPNYADASAWAARPQSDAAARAGVADVFFIHPTTDYDGRDGWNADIEAPESRRLLAQVALPNHAGPFAAAGPLWAPRYRQATLFALLTHREDAREALAFAYADVRRAFDDFVASRPDPSRPFILVGVGQGGLHALRLLSDAVVNQPVGAQLAAAYVIDQAAPLDLMAPGGALAGLAPCAGPGRTRCLVAYATVDAGDVRGARLLAQRAQVWTRDGGLVSVEGRPLACVNPINGGAAPDAPKRAHRGAAAASGLEPGTPPALLPAETGARCVDGAVIVEVNRAGSLTRPVWELGARYKTPAYNLFWADLEADALTRAQAAARARATDRRPG